MLNLCFADQELDEPEKGLLHMHRLWLLELSHAEFLSPDEPTIYPVRVTQDRAAYMFHAYTP